MRANLHQHVPTRIARRRRHSRVSPITNLVLGCLVATGPGGAAAQPTWQVVQITTGSNIDHDAAVSGTTVVWQRNVGSGGDIYMWTEGDPSITRLTNTERDHSPRIDQGRIIWNNNYQTGGDFEIKLWEDGTVTQLTNNTEDDWNADIAGTMKCWGVNNWYLIVDDGTQQFQVTANNGLDAYQRVGGDWMVWEAGNQPREIYLWDDGAVYQLTNNGYDDFRAETDGVAVVWSARLRDTASAIMRWRPDTGTMRLTPNSLFAFNPDISGGLIVFFAWDGNDYEIFFRYAGLTYQLTDNTFNDFEPAVDGTSIAWHGVEGGGYHIYYARIEGIEPGPAPGACCVSAECTTMTETACSAAGGSFAGEEVLCTVDLCPGAVAPASTWSTLQHDAQRSGRTAALVPADPVRLWSLLRESSPGIQPTVSPTVGPDGTVYVEGDQRLIAVNPDGSLQWQVRLFENLMATLSIRADGHLLVPQQSRYSKRDHAGGGELCSAPFASSYAPALDAAGGAYGPGRRRIAPGCTVSWVYAGAESFTSHVAIGQDGGVHVAAGFSAIKINAATGTRLWSYPTSGTAGPPAVGPDGTIYHHVSPNILLALNPNGTQRWSLTLTGLRNVGLQSPPAVAGDGSLYLASKTENGAMPTIVAVSSTGTELWRFTEPFGTGLDGVSPVIDGGGKVLFPVPGGDVVAISPADGSELWRIDLPDGEYADSSPAIAEDGTIYVTTNTGYLAAFGSGCPEPPRQEPPFNFRQVVREGDVVAGHTIGAIEAFDLLPDGRVVFQAQVPATTTAGVFTEQPGGTWDAIVRGTTIGGQTIDMVSLPRFDAHGNRYLAAYVANVGPATFVNNTLFVAERSTGNPVVQLNRIEDWFYVDHDNSGRFLVYGKQQVTDLPTLLAIHSITGAVTPLIAGESLSPEPVRGYSDDGMPVVQDAGLQFAILTPSGVMVRTGDVVLGHTLNFVGHPRRLGNRDVFYIGDESIFGRSAQGADTLEHAIGDTVAGYPILSIESFAANEWRDLAYRATVLGTTGIFFNDLPVAVAGTTRVNGTSVSSVPLVGFDEVSLNDARQIAFVAQRAGEPKALFVATLDAFDSDGDGDVDSADLDQYGSCFTDPEQTCYCLATADYNRDSSVDCTDWDELKRLWSGAPGTPQLLLGCDLDCNDNAVADELDIQSGSSTDCNNDHVPDECTPPAGIPNAEMILNPQGQPVVSGKNRALSFSGGDPGRLQAIRVTFVDLPEPWAVWNGTTLWVSVPSLACEVSGVAPGQTCPTGAPTFLRAGLTCVGPQYTLWSALGVVHVMHPGIVPGGRYEIQVVDSACSLQEVNYSIPLSLSNPRWGDIAGPYNVAAALWTAPNGSVDVTVDVVADLDKFSNRPSAPIKARADVEPCALDLRINITDVTRLLDAFRGLAYPFVPGVAPCPSDPCAAAYRG